MTLIASYIDKDKTVWLCGDSIGCSENNKTTRADMKIFYKDGYVVGFTSSYRFGQIIRHYVKLPAIPKKTRNHNHIIKIIELISEKLHDNHWGQELNNHRWGGQLIIGWPGNLYSIDTDFQYSQSVDPFLCVGSGSNYALGALSSLSSNTILKPEGLLLQAARTSSKFCATVGPPYHIINTDNYKQTYLD